MNPIELKQPTYKKQGTQVFKDKFSVAFHIINIEFFIAEMHC